MSTDILASLQELVTTSTNRANEIAQTVAKSGPKSQGKAISDLIKESEDEQFVKVRKAIEAIEQKRAEIMQRAEAYALELLNIKPLTEDELTVLSEEYKAKKKVVTETASLAKQLNLDINFPELLTFKGSTPGNKTGQGAGGRKPRLAGAEIDGKPFAKTVKNAKGENVEKVTFTLLRQEIGAREKAAGNPDLTISAADLQEAAFTEAGGFDNFVKSASVDFVVAGKDHNYTVRVFNNVTE